MKEIKSEYIRMSYYFWFQTSIPKGDTDIEKFLNLAIDVYPELKEAKLKSLKKNKDWDISKTSRRFKDGTFDVVINTSEGYFLIKLFDDVNFDEIKKLLDKVSKIHKDKDVFRLVCIIKKFENILDEDKEANEEKIQNYVDKIIGLKYNFKHDAIFVGKNRFNMLWIT